MVVFLFTSQFKFLFCFSQGYMFLLSSPETKFRKSKLFQSFQDFMFIIMRGAALALSESAAF